MTRGNDRVTRVRIELISHSGHDRGRDCVEGCEETRVDACTLCGLGEGGGDRVGAERYKEDD